MAQRRALRFAAEVEHYALVIAIGGAIVLDLPALVGMFHDSVSIISVLERFIVTYIFALLASRIVGGLLVRYVNESARREAEQAAAEADT